MKKGKIAEFLKYLSIFIWLGILIETDSYYSVYILIAIASTVAIAKNKKTTKHYTWLDNSFSAFFSLATTLANYRIFIQQSEQHGLHIVLAICCAIIALICGFIVFRNILSIFHSLTIKKTKEKTHSPRKTFLICFLIFCIVDITILFFCCYPGSLTPDSISEIRQILSGEFSNHHPFYYTILIYPFISIGINLFHNINVGVALFSLFQIIILSFAFAYSISTLQRIGVPKKILVLLSVFLLLLPYNIIYSFTIWKDVLFGAFFLIFTVTLYRYFHSIYQYRKSKYLQMLLIVISGIAVCLFRSNALLAIAATVIIFFIMFKRKYLKIGLVFVFVVVISFILKRPVLQQLNVNQTDLIESLSIPSQQIVKTLKYHKDQVSEEDITLINELADVDSLTNAYDPAVHDPVKKVIRGNNNQAYLKEHAGEYLMLYLKLGLKFPISYLTAWVDQTRGYWNGGYSYWIWANEVQANDYGIKRKETTFISEAFDGYLKMFSQVFIFQPFISIGLIIWLVFILLYRNIIAKNKIEIFLLIPILATWATLLIATPVFCEFRYVYFIFTTAPFLTIVTFMEKSKNSKPKILKEFNEKRP